MKIHRLIVLLILGLSIGGNPSVADGSFLQGLANFSVKPEPLGLIADESLSRSLSAEQQEPKSLETVLQSIERSLPGRALGARLVDRRGRQAYEIRWMGDNGKVSDITADALSGEIVDRR